MPLELIPNQPFVFEKPIGDYPCLNNDPTHYAQLVQDGDVTCLQWGLTACDEPLCEPNMIMDPVGSDELGAWTAGAGWSSTGSDNLSFDGGSGSGVAEQSLSSLTEGLVYRMTFNVTTYTGIVTYDVNLNFGPTNTINGTGSYTFYFVKDNYDDLIIGPNTTAGAGDLLVMEDIEFVQVTDCWQDGLVDNEPGPGVTEFFSWTYTYEAGQGKFCAYNTDAGDLINTTAFTTTGNYHGVTMVISNCTAGGLEVRLGSILLGTTSGNGQFDFYGVPTVGTDLVFTKVDGFDGCISQVNVEDFGDVGTAAVTVRSENNFYKSDGLTPTPFKDRLVQCIDWENLSWNMNGTPGDCIPLLVDIKDPCDNDEIYISINRAFYKSGGTTWDCTKLVEAWNDGYAFGLYFGDVNNPDFVLRQRLRVLQFSPVYRNSGEEYLYSSGASGRSFAQSQKARTAWFDYVDEYTHDCIRTQLLSSKLFVDGYAFFYPVEDYEPEWNDRGKYNLAQSRVTLLHEEAIFGSTCGTMANSVCPPQVIQLPCEFEQVQVLLDELDTSGLDLTVAELYSFEFDDAGVMASFGSGAYDLTNGIDRAAFATQIANTINSVFGTTTTSIACTVSGSLLSINVICEGTISLPMNSVSFSLFSIGSPSFSLPIYYA